VADDRTPAVRIRLLGGFELNVDGVPVPDASWRLRKARTLLKLLALAPGHRLHREQAIEVLWPDRPPAAAANNLHQVVHVARRRLGDAERLRLEDDVLRLCPDEPPWIDAEAFRERAAAALRSGDAEQARDALGLDVGPLLPEDLYEEWTEPARGELERLREELELVAEGDARLAIAARHNNLPGEPTAFIGRAAELEEVRRLLSRGPLVTLAGPAGCGKTRLALEAAAGQRERFSDGVWLVELAPLSQPELVADAVAAAIGIRLGRRSPAATTLVESLARRELLLVLDNCEHVVAATAALVDALLRGCPQIQVLATSREALRAGGEIVWRVPSLSLPDARQDVMESEAVRLFADRAAAADPRFAITDANAADVARICRRLDGMPLAIELAAARIGSLPPGEIERRLGESLRLLRGGRRAGDSRQETLEGALDWSYRLLDADEATLLRRLATFAGTFGLDATEGVCAGDGLPADDVVDVLLRLAGKSLVVAGEVDGRPRFRLLEMIRQYAKVRLAEAGEGDAMRERHARWYVSLATTLPEDGRLGRLDLEPDNFRAALSWLLDHDPPEALRLAGWLSDWWLLRGRLVEGRQWLERAVQRAPAATPAAAAALLRAVPFAGRAGDLGDSERLAERSLAIHRELGERAGVARALHMRALLAWLRGEHERAHAFLGDAIAEARAAPSPGTEINVVHTLGILAICARDLPRARARLEETLELLAAQPHAAEPPFLVITPGFVPVVPVRAAVQEESQITFRSVAEPSTAAAYVRMNVALVARLDGDPIGSDALLAEALAQLRAAGDDAGVAQALAAIGRLASLEGDAERARAALLESLAVRRRLGDVRSIGLTLGLLAELAAEGGDPDQARTLLRRAHAMFREAGDRPAMLWMLLALARLELAAGRDAPAREQLGTALALCESLGARTMRGWTLALIAQADLQDGRIDRSRELLADARRELEAAGDGWGLELCDALAGELSAR
jgi:predicted ATPase